MGHWGWGYGWLSAWGAYPDSNGTPRPIFNHNERSNGMIDFAGSGIVHMVGGVSGLMGAIVVGPRAGRFDADGQAAKLHDGNKTLQSLGVFILWFGWYGFNCGSTLGISGGLANIAGKVAMTTTLSASSGCIGATAITKAVEGVFDVSMGLNGILAGLVSITANCSVVNPWHAVVIGFCGSIVLCGFWGLIATGIFCTDANVQYAAYPNINTACKSGEQFGVQVLGGVAIVAWVARASPSRARATARSTRSRMMRSKH